jgi:phenylacetaldehyde dehydrogenase
MAATAENILTEYPLDKAAREFLARAGKMLIDGKWVNAESGKTFDVFDPASGAVIAQVASADRADVDKAVRAARKALEESAWATMTPANREHLMLKLADLVEAHAEELAQLESLDNGKPLGFARMIDIGTAPSFIRYMAGWATKIGGETIHPSINMGPDVKFFAYTLKEPVGVAAAIIPWNFPLQMALWKLCPALATGSTIVLKPAEQTPLTALRLGELVLEAGIPPGVVNIVTGFGETAGAALAGHPGIDKVAFTGSTEVGKIVARAAADNVTRVSLELGGKSPVIVLPDANVDMTVRGAAMGIFFNCGQVCAAGSRLYVHKKIYADVVEGVAEVASKMKLGPGLAPDTELGPVVSKEQQDRVVSYIKAGISEGAKLLAGGDTVDGNGYFVKPTVLGETRPDMKVVREEIFGPVLAAASYEDLDEVIRQANDTNYGLAASVWSNDFRAIQRVVPRLKAGTVWVNTHNLVDPAVPFGGYKQSGFGREMAKMVIDMYTETKAVYYAF